MSRRPMSRLTLLYLVLDLILIAASIARDKAIVSVITSAITGRTRVGDQCTFYILSSKGDEEERRDRVETPCITSLVSKTTSSLPLQTVDPAENIRYPSVWPACRPPTKVRPKREDRAAGGYVKRTLRGHTRRDRRRAQSWSPRKSVPRRIPALFRDFSVKERDSGCLWPRPVAGPKSDTECQFSMRLTPPSHPLPHTPGTMADPVLCTLFAARRPTSARLADAMRRCIFFDPPISRCDRAHPTGWIDYLLAGWLSGLSGRRDTVRKV